MPKEGDVSNPTGKGGFGDNPQNKANGRWSKDTSISYWYNHLIRLDIQEFEAFEPKTMAQQDKIYRILLQKHQKLSSFSAPYFPISKESVLIVFITNNILFNRYSEEI